MNSSKILTQFDGKEPHQFALQTMHCCMFQLNYIIENILFTRRVAVPPFSIYTLLETINCVSRIFKLRSSHSANQCFKHESQAHCSCYNTRCSNILKLHMLHISRQNPILGTAEYWFSLDHLFFTSFTALQAALFTTIAEMRMMPNDSCRMAYVLPAGNRHTYRCSHVVNCCCLWCFYL